MASAKRGRTSGASSDSPPRLSSGRFSGRPSAADTWRTRLSHAEEMIGAEEQEVNAAEENLQEVRDGIKSAETHIKALSDSKHRIVRLSVGGTKFDVPYSTLVTDETSFLAKLVNGGNGLRVARDSDDRIIIDRDAQSFRHILNFLRGYKLNLTPEELAFLACDVTYYGLSDMRSAMGLDETDESQLHFTAGPGVNPECVRLKGAYAVAPVGEKFLLTGKHSITFQIVAAEYVGIGVISDSCICFDQEFHRTANCCVYYMTGVFYSNFPHNRKEEGLEKYATGDEVTLTLDMSDKTLEFLVRGQSSRIVSCASATRLRFATVLKLDSEVRIKPLMTVSM